MEIGKIKKILEDMQNRKIVIFGDVMLDEHIFGKAERISPEAPVPVVIKESCVYGPGGAANVARNIKTLGSDVFLVGVIGNDLSGSRLKSILDSLKIKTDYLIVDNERPTSTKTRVIAQKQQIVRIDDEMIKNADDLESDIIEMAKKLIPDADIVVISDYGKGFITRSLVEKIVCLCKHHGKKTVADPKDNFSKYRGIDAITPNTKELEKFSGKKIRNYNEMVEAAKETLEKNGIENVLITRGEDGMTLVSKNRVHDIPAINVKGFDVVDVSGAGDTVVALLALCASSNLSMEESSKIANYGAGVVVRKLGVVDVTVSELEEELEKAGDAYVKRKIRTVEELEKILNRHRDSGKKIVSTNGCFDIIHTGHVKHLEEVKKLGDILIVGINSDESVRRLKGPARPINTLEERMEIISALDVVDYVFPFDEDDPRLWLSRLKPDIHAKGAGYSEENLVEKSVVESYGGRTKILQKHGEKSSSSIINRMKKNKAVFIDRDGVINKEIGAWVKHVDEFEFLPNVKEAMKRIKQSGYKLIIITNQSGIGRGYMTEEELKKIHRKMIDALGEEGIDIDGLYFCPHTTEDGCNCRKPKPGMLERAAQDHEINIKESFLVGDSERDIMTGKAVGCKTILVGSEKEINNALADFTADDLCGAVDIILNEKSF